MAPQKLVFLGFAEGLSEEHVQSWLATGMQGGWSDILDRLRKLWPRCADRLTRLALRQGAEVVGAAAVTAAPQIAVPHRADP